MTTPLARTLLVSTTILGACGGAGSGDVVRTGPPPVETADLEAEASAAIRALDEIAETRVCITPELCEDFREWRPDSLFVLDGHLTATDRSHAFIRVGDAWVHHALSARNVMTTNGHSLFFCDAGGGVFELSLAGVQRLGILPSNECAAVVSSGSQLYVVQGSGPVLRQDGNRWTALELELHYGNGYSVDTVAMTRTRAFMLDDEGQLLEFPTEGPSFEPRVVAETRLGRMATMLAVPGTERIVALAGESEERRASPAFAIIDGVEEDGAMRRVVRSLDLPRAAGEPMPTRASEAPSNEDEGERYDEEEEDEEEEVEDVDEAGEEVLDLGAAIVGLDPLMIARRRATFEGGAVGTIAIEHFVLTDAGWTPLAASHPEVFHIAVGQGAFGTDMPDRTVPLALGPFRVVVNAYHEHTYGPRVTAWRNDGTEVALSAFDLDARQRVAIACAGEDESAMCLPLANGGFLRVSSVREGRRAIPRSIELLDADLAVRLSYTVASRVEQVDAASFDGFFLSEAERPLGYVDSNGYHPVVLPEGTRVTRIRALSGTRAYVFAANDQIFFVDGASVEPVANAAGLANSWCWPTGDGCVLGLDDDGFVWLHGNRVDRITLGDAVRPDLARSAGRTAVTLAAPNGTTWILEDGEVSVVSAPSPDEAHRDGPIYFVPDTLEDAQRWEVHFGRPGLHTQRYRTSAPTTRRAVGPLSSFVRPYRAPVVRLRRRDLQREARALDEAGPQPDSLLAYWESPDDTGMRPRRWVGSLVVADASMRNVVFLTQPDWLVASYDPPTAVARFVAGRESRASASSGDDAAARARAFVTPTMTEALAFALEGADSNAPPLAGLVPAGPRAGEILRVQVERGRTVVLDVIDRGNSRATRVGTTTLPSGNRLTFAVAAVSSDGSHVAVTLGLREEDDPDAEGATASHLVLPLPPAPSAE